MHHTIFGCTLTIPVFSGRLGLSILASNPTWDLHLIAWEAQGLSRDLTESWSLPPELTLTKYKQVKSRWTRKGDTQRSWRTAVPSVQDRAIRPSSNSCFKSSSLSYRPINLVFTPEKMCLESFGPNNDLIWIRRVPGGSINNGDCSQGRRRVVGSLDVLIVWWMLTGGKACYLFGYSIPYQYLQ